MRVWEVEKESVSGEVSVREVERERQIVKEEG